MDLFQQDLRIDNHTVSNQAFFPGVQDSGRNQMTDGLFTVDDEGVADTGTGFPKVDIGAYERDVNSPPPDTTFHVPGDYNTIQEAIFAS